MRTVSPVFARNAKLGHSRIDALSQSSQLRTGVDPDPKYARSLRGGKEAVSTHPNFKPAALNPPQTLSDGLDLLPRLFSDEFQRNVQRLRTHPARIGHKTLDAFKEARDARANFRIKIDADKYSHLTARVVTGLWPVRKGRSLVSTHKYKPF
jgi:hypothetical protein